MTWQQYKFTPAWSKIQWVHWASKRWPNESIDKFKQMRKKQLIAIVFKQLKRKMRCMKWETVKHTMK